MTRHLRERAWVVALALFVGGFLCRSILAVREAESIAAAQATILAFQIGWLLWVYWMIFRASREWLLIGGVIGVLFSLGALFTVLSFGRP
jgi:hypothetical protein